MTCVRVRTLRLLPSDQARCSCRTRRRRRYAGIGARCGRNDVRELIKISAGGVKRSGGGNVEADENHIAIGIGERRTIIVDGSESSFRVITTRKPSRSSARRAVRANSSTKSFSTTPLWPRAPLSIPPCAGSSTITGPTCAGVGGAICWEPVCAGTACGGPGVGC